MKRYQYWHDPSRVTRSYAIKLLDSDQLCLMHEAEGKGRRNVFIHKTDNKKIVIKHYARGGYMAYLLNDRYFYTGSARTRPFAEFILLKKLCQLRLPVPQPIAARIESSVLFYKGSIATEYIPDTVTLADIVISNQFSARIWNSVGALIRKLHDCNVYHSDLNANNILINKNNYLYLIDFDKSFISNNLSERLKKMNLKRLCRSLDKIAFSGNRRFQSDERWERIIEGYTKNPVA